MDLKKLTSRQRFLAATECQAVDRPPVWVMRQAGRYLPEYRALKAQHGFLRMVKTPELAAEVTLQPLKRFALDAAIIFSDILIIPEALGQPYHFRDEGGIGMDFALDSLDKIKALKSASAIPEKLDYVGDALRVTRNELGDSKALLGFAGSPWTLACYMIEGGSSKNFAVIKTLALREPAVFARLMETLSDAVAALLRLKIDAGVDAVQLFDSWGAACPGAYYHAWSLQWISRIIKQLPKGFPVILYAKGMAAHAPALASTGVSVLSLDWTADLPGVHAQLNGQTAVQGNLDPVLMTTDPEIVTTATRNLLNDMNGKPGYIVNLGHGITPDAKVECMEALVNTVTGG